MYLWYHTNGRLISQMRVFMHYKYPKLVQINKLWMLIKGNCSLQLFHLKFFCRMFVFVIFL